MPNVMVALPNIGGALQSAAAEIRQGKKRRRRRTNHSMKIYMVCPIT